jgi:hypothetical protein
MKVIERPTETLTPRPAVAASKRPWFVVALAVLALVVGGAIGWFVRGGEDDPDAMLVGGGSLSDRQQQMVDLVETYDDGWVAGDPDEVLSYFTADGVFVASGQEYRVDDGTFADVIDFVGFSSLERLRPILVQDDQVFFVSELQGVPTLNALTFTTEGELLIARHDAFDIYSFRI